jgi:acetyl esterase/lipase
MPLDRHAKRLLEMISAGRGETVAQPTAESLRRSMLRLAEVADARHVPIGGIEDRTAPGPGGPIAMRVYTPVEADAGPLACIVYFHGGTGVFGGIVTHDGLCRLLANASGCRVISIEYRLAPEHPFPAAIEDAMAATTWIVENAPALEIDPARLVVAGDSAGGTVAAVLCQLATQTGAPQIALQLLLCPVTDLADETESRRAFAQGYFIDRSTLVWAKQAYCDAADWTDPRVSPLRASSVTGLPPAHIHTAEFDPMRDEGVAYARRLQDAGVSVRYACHEGMIHHFYCMAGAIPQARNILTSIGASVREALRQAASEAIR